MSDTLFEATNETIKDVVLFWAKLDKPVEPFGTPQWEIQIRFPKKRIKEMEQYGKVKETDTAGTYQLNLKKKAVLKSGEDAKRVMVVDKKGAPVDPRTLGNGSTGNVRVMLKDYQIKGPKGNVTKEGTQVMLIAVQVTDLKKYEPKVGGFDYDDEDEESTPVKAAPKKSAPKTSIADEDDDIPF